MKFSSIFECGEKQKISEKSNRNYRFEPIDNDLMVRFIFINVYTKLLSNRVKLNKTVTVKLYVVLANSIRYGFGSEILRDAIKNGFNNTKQQQKRQ